MNEYPDLSLFLQNLWLRENAIGLEAIEGKGGYSNGKYYPYKTPNGNIDVGPGFDMDKQTSEFRERAAKGFTKEELDNMVLSIARNELPYFRRRIIREGSNPDKVTDAVYNGLLDMYWQLKNGLYGYDKFWKAVASGDYEGMRNESATYYSPKNGKIPKDAIVKDGKILDTGRWDFRKTNYFKDPEILSNTVNDAVVQTSPIMEPTFDESMYVERPNVIRDYKPVVFPSNTRIDVRRGMQNKIDFNNFMDSIRIQNNLQTYNFPIQFNKDETTKNSQYDKGGSLKFPQWDNLSVKEKADVMKVAISNGITNLSDIRQQYNEFAEGGPKKSWTMEDEANYRQWRNSLPDNLKYTDDNIYDMVGAYQAGMQPTLEDDGLYHLGSRDPQTGKILKAPYHPTYLQALSTDARMGYYPTTDDKGNTYTSTWEGNNSILPEEKIEVPYRAYGNGGSIHIKPSHRGRLTKLKKRTGKTEAELYNDGNPAHKKMVVFARNARNWHDLGGNLFDTGGPTKKDVERLFWENKMDEAQEALDQVTNTVNKELPEITVFPERNQGEITPVTGNALSRAINNYTGELKYDLANGRVPGGKYTLPAAVLGATGVTGLAKAGEMAYAAGATPLIMEGMNVPFVASGLNNLAHGNADWQTALEITPLGKYVKPMTNSALHYTGVGARHAIANSNIGKRAIEVAMRTTSAQNPVGDVMYGLAKLPLKRKIDVANYILTGKVGNTPGYNNLGMDPVGYRGFFGPSDFTPQEGYGDVIDAFLWNKELDPRLAVRVKGDPLGMHKEYVNKNYPNKKIKVYQSNISKGSTDVTKDMEKQLDLGELYPSKIKGVDGAMPLDDKGALKYDSAGHLLGTFGDDGRFIQEQDIWKFLSKDYVKKWLNGTPSFKQRFLKWGLDTVDEAGTPIIVRSPILEAPQYRSGEYIYGDYSDKFYDKMNTADLVKSFEKAKDYIKNSGKGSLKNDIYDYKSYLDALKNIKSADLLKATDVNLYLEGGPIGKNRIYRTQISGKVFEKKKSFGRNLFADGGITYDGGTLPELQVTGYAPIRLTTYYPVVSKYPYTGHSKLEVPIDTATWNTYKEDSVFGERTSPYLTISKGGSSRDYNLLTNNCADATLSYLNSAFNTKENPILFTTPGDVRDYAINILGGKVVEGKEKGSDIVLIPRNADNYKQLSEDAVLWHNIHDPRSSAFSLKGPLKYNKRHSLGGNLFDIGGPQNPPVRTTGGAGYVPPVDFSSVTEDITNIYKYLKNYFSNKLSEKDGSAFIDLSNKNVSRIKKDTKGVETILTNEFVEDNDNTIKTKKQFKNTTDTLLGDRKIPLSKISTFYGIEDGKLKAGSLDDFKDETVVIPNRAKNVGKVVKVIAPLKDERKKSYKIFRDSVSSSIDTYNKERGYKPDFLTKLGYLVAFEKPSPFATLHDNTDPKEYRHVTDSISNIYRPILDKTQLKVINEKGDTISGYSLNATPKALFANEQGNAVFVSDLHDNERQLNDWLKENPSYPIMVDNGRYGNFMLSGPNVGEYIGFGNPDKAFVLGTTKKSLGGNLYAPGGPAKTLNPSVLRAMKYFMDRGFTDYQAAGFVGNLMRESSMDPNALNKWSNAFGLAQWLGDRRNALFAMYGPKPTFEQQLDFIWHELNTTHKNGLKYILASKDAEEAARNTMGYYEFSAGPEGAIAAMNKHKQNGQASMDRGIEFAKQFYGYYNPMSLDQQKPQDPVLAAKPMFNVNSMDNTYVEKPRYYDIPMSTPVNEQYSPEVLAREQARDNLNTLATVLGILDTHSKSPVNILKYLAI